MYYKINYLLILTTIIGYKHIDLKKNMRSFFFRWREKERRNSEINMSEFFDMRQ